MRLLGIVLVIAGALLLGYQGFGMADSGSDPRPERAERVDTPTPISSAAVLGGIAITAGLIMVTVGEKDDE
jgi:threonine/homoserine/homoserine lactone efflux protein